MEGCYQCDQINPQVCQRCIIGYLLAGNTTCLLDVACNTNYSCYICPVNYAVVNGTCKVCNTSGNCTQCANGNINLCIQCKTGFYLNNATCYQCNETCLTCSQSDRCQVCKDGFYLPTDVVFGNCTKCNPMCKTCSN